MKPAEIDRLVATKVMGWSLTNAGRVVVMDPKYGRKYAHFSPSTNIKDAMEVLEVFTGYGTGKTCQVPPYQEVCDEVKYWCEVYQREVHDQTGEEQVLTYGANNANLPIAISLAALRAKGVPV